MASSAGHKRKLFYGWVVLLVSVVVGTAIWGTRYSFGIFFNSIEGEFALNRVVTSAVFSSYMVLASLFTVAWGWALDKYGPRILTLMMGLLTGLSLLLTSQVHAFWLLFLSYSLLLALGTAGSYTVLITTVSRWFNKKRGLAVGIAGVSSGVGVLSIARLTAFLIAGVGWRNAYVVLGVAVLAVGALSLLLRKSPETMGLQPDGGPRLAAVQARLASLQSTPPARPNSTQLINKILLLADECQVKAIPLTTQDWTSDKASKGYEVFRLHITATGGFAEIVDFLERLENKDYSNLVIESLAVSRVTGVQDQAADSDAAVAAGLDVAIYAGAGNN